MVLTCRAIDAAPRPITQVGTPGPGFLTACFGCCVEVYSPRRNGMKPPGYARSNPRKLLLASGEGTSMFTLNRRRLLTGTVAGVAASTIGRGTPITAPQPLIARAQDAPQGGTLTYGVGFDV